MSQQVFLEPDGSGTVTVRIRMEKLFMDYLKDLAEVAGESANDKVFNVEEIKKGFAKRDDVQLKRIASPSPERLEMELSFKSVEKLFAGEKMLQEAGILSFARKNDNCTVKLHLDRKNFAQVMELLPALKNPLFEGLGPQENDTTTEEEYLQLIDLALGEGGSASLKASFIETKVTVKGKLISQTGGTPMAGGVVFRIPLTRVLLLDKPLDYSLSFK